MMNRGPGFFAAPLPPPLPHSTVSNLSSFSVFLCVAGRAYCGRGEGVGEEPNYTTARKAKWPSINHSILSAVYPLPFLQCPTPFSSVPVTLLPLPAAVPPSLLLPLQLQITASASPPAIPLEAEFLDVVGAKKSL